MNPQTGPDPQAPSATPPLRRPYPRNNFTMIPNDFFEYAMDMSHGEKNVMLYVFRRTYGWNKEAAPISVREFLHGRPDCPVPDTGTHLNRSTLFVALRSLIEAGHLNAERRQRPDGGNDTTLYSLAIEAEPESENPTPLDGRSTQGLGRADHPGARTGFPPKLSIRRKTNVKTDQQTLPLKRAQPTIARSAPEPTAAEQAAARVLGERELKAWERTRLRRWTAAGHSPGRIEEALSKAADAGATSPFAYAGTILDGAPTEGETGGPRRQGQPRRSTPLSRRKVRPAGDVAWEQYASATSPRLPAVPGFGLDSERGPVR